MRMSTLAAVLGLLSVPATAPAADPAAESKAAWKQVASATFTLDQDALADVLERAPAEGPHGPEADDLGAGARRRLRALRGRRVARDGAGAGGRAPGDQDLHGARPRRPDRDGAARSHARSASTRRCARRPGPGTSTRATREHVAYRRRPRPRSRSEELERRARPHAPRRPAAGRGGRRPGHPARLPAGAASRTRPTRTVTPGHDDGGQGGARQPAQPDLRAGPRDPPACSSPATTSSTSTRRPTATGTNGPCGAAACYTADAAADAATARRSTRTNAVAGRILGAGELRPRAPGDGRRRRRPRRPGRRRHAVQGRRVHGAARARSATRSTSTTSPTRSATSSAPSTRSTAAICADNRRRHARGAGRARERLVDHGLRRRVRRATTCRPTRTRTSRTPRSRRSTRRR